MSDVLASTLFQSETRTALLNLLFVRGLAASVSELARRAELSPRAVANEVRHLRPTGLVLVASVGGADVVRANLRHAGARHLRALLQTPSMPPADPDEAKKVRESLAAWRAPLAGVRPRKHHSLEEALLRGLDEARRDGTVLRVLPTMVARNAAQLKWPDLREEARRRKLKAELGVVVDLCARLAPMPQLSDEVAALRDLRRKKMTTYPEVKSEYEATLARLRSPEVAQQWGFWMNITEESFRSVLDKHRA